MQITSNLKLKTVAFLASTVCLCIVGAYVVLAWTEPSQAPPGGNVATPINIGPQAQEKLGPLSATQFGGSLGIGYLNPDGDSLIDGILNVVAFCDKDYDVCANPLNDGWLHVRNKANNIYKGVAASQYYIGNSSTYWDGYLNQLPLNGNLNLSSYDLYDSSGDLTVSDNLYVTGNVGIGVTGPTQKLDVNGYVKGTGLCIGSICKTTWPAGEVGDITAVTAGAGLSGGGTTGDVTVSLDTSYADNRYVNVSGDTMTGALTVNANATLGQTRLSNSDIYFTNTTHNHTGIGNTAGYAAIENAANHNTLMILGRAGTSVGRSVSIWDYLTVNGSQKITGSLTVDGGGSFVNPVSVGTPTQGSHAVTKSYMDSAISTGVAGGTAANALRCDADGTCETKNVSASGDISATGNLTVAGGTINNLNSSYRWVGGSNWNTFYTPSGYIQLGPANSDWAHIYTDRAKTIFNTPVYSVADTFSSYDADLQLQRIGSTKLTLTDSGATVNGNLSVTGGYFYGYAGQETLRTTDEWLRLNQAGHFANGVYTPSMLRADGGFQVDGKQVISAAGNRFYPDSNVTNDSSQGVFWHGDSTAYAIYREPGAWSGAYPDLRIAFYTGIKLGAHASYNGIRFYNNHDMAGLVMSVNDASTGGAGNVYMTGSLTVLGGGSFVNPVSVGAPIADSHATTKSYVDSAIQTGVGGGTAANALRCDADGTCETNDIAAAGNLTVTGSAQAVKFDGAYTPRYQTWASQGTGAGGAAIYNDNGSYKALMVVGSDQGQGYSRWVRVWDSLWANTRVDAPIYYDSSNTGYYVDPAGTTAARFLGSISLANDGTFIDPGSGYAQIQNHAGHLYIGPDSSASDYIIFRHGGDNKIYFRLNGNVDDARPEFRTNGSYLVIGAAEDQPMYLQWDQSAADQHVYVNGYVTPNRMYDRDNTNFYVDPASESNLHTLNAYWYDVNPGEGYGVRFWNSNSYAINMGNSVEYRYGPVTDYSIKMNMSNTAGRGWTWGVDGAVPVAAISKDGNMQIAGTLTVNDMQVVGTLTTNKLKVQTIDPVYEIDGVEYATYVSDFAGGVRTETSGILRLTAQNDGGRAVIDFDSLEKGSDLWLFWQTSNQTIEDLVVGLTPGFNGDVWYEKRGNKLIIHGSNPGEVSYRLTLPREDHGDWGNLVDEVDE